MTVETILSPRLTLKKVETIRTAEKPTSGMSKGVRRTFNSSPATSFTAQKRRRSNATARTSACFGKTKGSVAVGRTRIGKRNPVKRTKTKEILFISWIKFTFFLDYQVFCIMSRITYKAI